MSQVLVWKSDADGKLFEDKIKYQKHLRKLGRERLARRKLEIAEAEKDAVWAGLYECEQSLEQWRDMIITKQDLFWTEAAEGDKHKWSIVGKTRKGVTCPVPRLLEFSEFSLNWNNSVGNTHDCPVGGVTNFAQSYNRNQGQNLPEGYPGWSGRADWIVAWPKEWDGHYLGSDLFSRGTFRSGRQRAHTGTGGGGNMRFSEKHRCYVQSFGYDFRIFAADWPGMFRWQMKQEWLRIANRNRQKAWQQIGGVGQPALIQQLPNDWSCDADPSSTESVTAQLAKWQKEL